MWKSFFDGLGSLFTDIVFAPLHALARLELTNWWLANLITWIFIIICCGATFYWLKQLKIFANRNEDDQDTTAHSFLK